jgi:hypothetical protein
MNVQGVEMFIQLGVHRDDSPEILEFTWRISGTVWSRKGSGRIRIRFSKRPGSGIRVFIKEGFP